MHDACILGIDCSEHVCSVALWSGQTMLSDQQTQPRRHAEVILPMIQSLLDRADKSLRQVDALAFSCGPGAFTGLRIGASVVQGLCFGADIPVIPVSTLQALAFGASLQTGHVKIMAALDARMDQVYLGGYLFQPERVESLIPDQVINPESLKPSDLEAWRLRAGAWTGVGSGWRYQEELIFQLGQPDAMEAGRYCCAQDVVHWCLQYAGTKDYFELADTMPVYLRDKVV